MTGKRVVVVRISYPFVPGGPIANFYEKNGARLSERPSCNITPIYTYHYIRKYTRAYQPARSSPRRKPIVRNAESLKRFEAI